jgi:DNA repair exonuclease SbcCD nuclease subunit
MALSHWPKILYVGDVHSEPSSLKDCYRLSDLIVDVIKNNEVKTVVYLGDQFHTHSVLHLSVMDFWKKHFTRVDKTLTLSGEDVGQIALVGNHDRSNNSKSTVHSMLFFDDVCSYISESCYIMPNVMGIGFQFESQRFLELAAKDPDVALVCHQTFLGSKYDNGFPAKDGIDMDLVPQKVIISGHIHRAQKINKVWYPGSPRWTTMNDANAEKAIWLVEHGEKGEILSTQAFDTGEVCSKIIEVDIYEGIDQNVITSSLDDRVFLNLHGSYNWIKETKENLKNKSVHIRTFPTKTKKAVVRESDGVPQAFKKYVDDYVPKNGTSKEELIKLVNERVGWDYGR